MIQYLLDSNICIHFLRGKFNIYDKLLEIGIENCAISEITLAELTYGAEKSNNTNKNLKLIENFTNQLDILPILNVIPIYAKEKVRLQNLGRMISDFDLLIGSTCVANDLIMVTENTHEFSRILNLKIENWVIRD